MTILTIADEIAALRKKNGAPFSKGTTPFKELTLLYARYVRARSPTEQRSLVIKQEFANLCGIQKAHWADIFVTLVKLDPKLLDIINNPGADGFYISASIGRKLATHPQKEQWGILQQAKDVSGDGRLDSILFRIPSGQDCKREQKQKGREAQRSTTSPAAPETQQVRAPTEQLVVTTPQQAPVHEPPRPKRVLGQSDVAFLAILAKVHINTGERPDTRTPLRQPKEWDGPRTVHPGKKY